MKMIKEGLERKVNGAMAYQLHQTHHPYQSHPHQTHQSPTTAYPKPTKPTNPLRTNQPNFNTSTSTSTNINPTPTPTQPTTRGCLHLYYHITKSVRCGGNQRK